MGERAWDPKDVGVNIPRGTVYSKTKSHMGWQWGSELRDKPDAKGERARQDSIVKGPAPIIAGEG